jgi:hypothetical protein
MTKLEARQTNDEEGKGHLDLGPIGVSEGPNIDQGANLGLWAESVWLSALWLSDPRVRWETADGVAAIRALSKPAARCRGRNGFPLPRE